MLYPLTHDRLLNTRAQWGETLNLYRGEIPLGYMVAHMVADSNGVTAPVSADLIKRPVGIMQVPLREASRFKYKEKDLETPRTNIKAAAQVINFFSEHLYDNYKATWPTPTQDYWCAVRLLYVVNFTPFARLIVKLTGTKTLTTLLAYMNTVTTRVGRHHPRDLKKFSAHITEFKNALQLLDGNAASTHYASQIPMEVTA